jgi:hypothetical protein
MKSTWSRIPLAQMLNEYIEVLQRELLGVSHCHRDLERLSVGRQEAHPRQHGFVVADRRIGRAALVAEPAQVAADELAERRLALRLVLHHPPG